jgi:ribosomal protein S18 acetylase RimI-like enzyme
MAENNVHLIKAIPGAGAPRRDVDLYPLINFREPAKSDLAYMKDLAWQEIGVFPRRLPGHQTFLIYMDKRRIGFIAYRRILGKYLYIYMLALEEEAQNQGYANLAFRKIFFKETVVEPVEGIFARIHKTNSAALHVTQEKHGFKVVKETARYYTVFRQIAINTE